MKWNRCLNLALAALLAGPAPVPAPAQNDRAEVLLESARQKALIEGNLEAAIQQYKQILGKYSGNRAVAARALVGMGRCYEKLGNAEARGAYERVLRDYADQREMLVEARSRLAALSGAPGTPARSDAGARRVWAEASVNPTVGNLYAAVSADGRFLVHVDWGTGDVTLRELATGEKRNLTKNLWASGEFAMSCAVSPDAKQVAYQWLNKDLRWDLRMVGLDGSGPRVLHREAGVGAWVAPKAWSADGKKILAVLSATDGAYQIVLVDVAGGAVRVLKSPSPAAGQMSFSPDGRYIVYDAAPRRDSPARDIFLLSTDASREIPLVQHPADDFVLGWSPDGKHVLFASDRTGTLDAWVIAVDDGKPRGFPALVRQGLGRIQPIGFAGNGSYYCGLRTGLRDVHIAEMDLESGKVLAQPALAASQFVGSNTAPDWSPDGRYLAYLSNRATGPGLSRFICIRSVKTGEVRELSPGLNFMYRLRWFPDGRSLYVTNDASGKPDLYRVDAETGKASAVHKDVAETAFSRDGRTVYYWRFDYADKQYPIIARDLETGREKELHRGPQLRSMSVSPDGRHLAFVQRPPQAGASVALKVMPVSGGAPRTLIEAVNWLGPVTWMPDSRQLLFAQGDELLRMAMEGGEPHKLGPAMERLSDLRIHPDGRRLAFVAGRHKTEIWVMENFLPALRP